jgi:hypothetical protein
LIRVSEPRNTHVSRIFALKDNRQRFRLFIHGFPKRRFWKSASHAEFPRFIAKLHEQFQHHFRAGKVDEVETFRRADVTQAHRRTLFLVRQQIAVELLILGHAAIVRRKFISVNSRTVTIF